MYNLIWKVKYCKSEVYMDIRIVIGNLPDSNGVKASDVTKISNIPPIFHWSLLIAYQTFRHVYTVLFMNSLEIQDISAKRKEKSVRNNKSESFSL